MMTLAQVSKQQCNLEVRTRTDAGLLHGLHSLKHA